MWPFKKGKKTISRDTMGKDALAEKDIEEEADKLLNSREKELSEEEVVALHPKISEEEEDGDPTGVVDMTVESVKSMRERTAKRGDIDQSFRQSIRPLPVARTTYHFRTLSAVGSDKR